MRPKIIIKTPANRFNIEFFFLKINTSFIFCFILFYNIDYII
jgi:hypothetical protein